MKDRTPEHLMCTFTASCPYICELEDGRLLIIGTRSGPDLAHFVNERLGNGETAVVIPKSLLGDIIAAEVAAATAGLREAISDTNEFSHG